MKLKMIGWITGIAMLFSLSCQGCKETPVKEPEVVTYHPVMPEKTNATKVFMHYMPWFESKDFSGAWGTHWRMANRNPEKIDGNGKREIASHYYPLIGPYDSGDPFVIEYHLLLMKYAGIDGILIDWYGMHQALDYHLNFDNSEALISRLDTVGIGFGIVYEEYVAEAVSKRTGLSTIAVAQEDLIYMEQNYFTQPQYLHVEEAPLLLTFGPRFFKTATNWTEIFSAGSSNPFFMPLWGHDHLTGATNTDGEYAWIDFNYDMRELTKFYSGYTAGLAMGSVFPGFHDFYAEGGWGTSYGFVSHLSGETFDNTLQKAVEYNLPYIQLVTWNDFGEGTMMEPTQEFGFSYLEKIQAFTGVSYTKKELELIYEFYQKRVSLRDNTAAQLQLDEAFMLLNELNPAQAETIIKNL